MRVTQALMGHSTVSTTERYAHLAPSVLKSAIDKLGTQTLLNLGNPWAMTATQFLSEKCARKVHGIKVALSQAGLGDH